jgi:citronellol/citronellal dehydrogenase
MTGENPALHPDLGGRVAVVTGASRGIGKALALRLAREGADVVIAAKSEQSTDRLPGSIHETADEVRALGRRALAVRTDVRDEDAVRNLVERTVAEFGRLDILVNNAGAIWTRPILETPPKRFDLMAGVNVRAAYIACYYALPQMVKQQWGHILNMCPRLNCEPAPGRVAYSISKSGMARLAIGLAAEHARDNIAANTLWPRTIIESQASINWKMADRSQWRTPEILCDAACAIFSREPRTSTGRQWIDEDALAELAGVTEFDRYWCEGKPPEYPIYIDRW